MNSLLYYYNNVQKMAAYRQAKRMQRGVKLGYGENPSVSSSTKFTMPPVTIGLSDYSIEYFGNSIGSIGSNPAYMKTSVGVRESGGILAWGYEDGSNGVNIIRFGNTSDGASNQVYPNVKFDNDDPFHLVITRQGNEIKIYVNNELAITWDTREVLDMGDMDLIFANSSDVGFVRVWNYALSADDVTAHYNNGDPMGYVVPKAMRELLSVNLIGSNSFTWDGSDSPYYYNITGNPITIGKYYKINVTVSDYQSGSPRIFAGISYPIPAQNGTFDIVVYNERYVNNFPIYGGSDGDPNRHLTITVNSITSVGLLAEYLPQNLMESRKGPAVEPKAKIYEFNIGDEYYKSVLTQAKYPYDCIYRVDYVVDEWDYQPKPIGSVGFLGLTGATILTPDGQDWSTLEKAKVGESRTLLVKMPGSGTPALYIYGGNDYETATARHLKVTIKGITPVSVPISWLDSAKQLPLSDEYMEPLFQSIGGYDMAANGAPEILYNE
jgi:hypothetical protein